MKVAPLLVQYLITHRRLDLAGIGSFLLDEPLYPETENHRPDKQGSPGMVSFESNAAIKQSPDLVEFIATQTGKIKALSAADLESHLALAKQFLNIGNPFLFEGIGTLVKIRSGEYALLSGQAIPEKTNEYMSRENQGGPASRDSLTDYKKIFYSGNIKTKWRKPVIILLIIAGLALAVWGGYTVYKMKRGKNKAVTENNNKKEEPIPVKDTLVQQTDSLAAATQVPPSGMLKFILEVCNAQRANERYGRLRTFQWNVQMETKDSVTYKLFMILPGSASDTSRLLDSLSRLNGRRVYIEQ